METDEENFCVLRAAFSTSSEAHSSIPQVPRRVRPILILYLKKVNNVLQKKTSSSKILIHLDVHLSENPFPSTTRPQKPTNYAGYFRPADRPTFIIFRPLNDFIDLVSPNTEKKSEATVKYTGTHLTHECSLVVEASPGIMVALVAFGCANN